MFSEIKSKERYYRKLERVLKILFWCLVGLFILGFICGLFSVFEIIDNAIGYFAIVCIAPIFLLFIFVFFISVRMRIIADELGINDTWNKYSCKSNFPSVSVYSTNVGYERSGYKWLAKDSSVSCYSRSSFLSSDSSSYIHSSNSSSSWDTFSTTDPGRASGYMGYSTYASYLSSTSDDSYRS